MIQYKDTADIFLILNCEWEKDWTDNSVAIAWNHRMWSEMVLPLAAEATERVQYESPDLKLTGGSDKSDSNWETTPNGISKFDLYACEQRSLKNGPKERIWKSEF